MQATVSGIDLRISQGKKSPDDLRLDARLDGRWIPLQMELVFFMADFYAENEDELRKHRSFWRENGQRYFMNQVASAIREGWQRPSELIRRQRGERS